MVPRELELLIDELYSTLSDILSKEKLSVAARSALESIKEKIHEHKARTVRPAAKAAPPLPPIPTQQQPLPSPQDELPDYNDTSEYSAEVLPEYEICDKRDEVVPPKEVVEVARRSPTPSSASSSEDVTVQSLLGVAVMHGILLRKDRKYMMEQSKKCWAAATSTAFHLFNSEADQRPAVTLRLAEVEVKLPPSTAKDKKRDLIFEVVCGSKRYKFVTQSASERKRWVAVLDKAETTPSEFASPSVGRSLPETPLDSNESYPMIEEDKLSLENYEVMSPNDNAEVEDIYNSVEDIPAAAAHVAPPQVTRKAQAPPPPPHPNKLQRNASTLHDRINVNSAVYDDAGSAPGDVYDDAGGAPPCDVYDDAGGAPLAPLPAAARPEEVYDDAGGVDEDMYYDIAEVNNLRAQGTAGKAAPAADEIYDDAAPPPPPPTPWRPSDKKVAPPPPPTRRPTLTLEPKTPDPVVQEEPMDEYDDVSPGQGAPPPPMMPQASKVKPPPPPAQNMKNVVLKRKPSFQGTSPASPTSKPDLASELSMALKKRSQIKDLAPEPPVAQKTPPEQQSEAPKLFVHNLRSTANLRSTSTDSPSKQPPATPVSGGKVAFGTTLKKPNPSISEKPVANTLKKVTPNNKPSGFKLNQVKNEPPAVAGFKNLTNGGVAKPPTPVRGTNLTVNNTRDRSPSPMGGGDKQLSVKMRAEKLNSKLVNPTN